MRLPNGYGSVHKLPGKRRKPFRARRTVGWKYVDKKTGKEIKLNKDMVVSTVIALQKFETIGYYATRKEALQALADYNANPYDINASKVTFAEVYEKWSEEHYEEVAKRTVIAYKMAYDECAPLHDMKFAEIKLDHLQKCFDESGKNTPTLKLMKALIGQLFKFAVAHEIVSPDKKETASYINIKKAGNPDANKREPFTSDEIKKIWEIVDLHPYASTLLMLIYSGVRISELLDLKKEDVHLDERFFYITEAKTNAGVRVVPISDKTLCFFEDWMNKPGEYLITGDKGKHLPYSSYYMKHWKTLMEMLSMEHSPHSTRHSCVSMLTAAGIDARIIKKIIGHSAGNVTEDVYTHIELPALLDAINKI